MTGATKKSCPMYKTASASRAEKRGLFNLNLCIWNGPLIGFYPWWSIHKFTVKLKKRNWHIQAIKHLWVDGEGHGQGDVIHFIPKFEDWQSRMQGKVYKKCSCAASFPRELAVECAIKRSDGNRNERSFCWLALNALFNPLNTWIDKPLGISTLNNFGGVYASATVRKILLF